MAVTFAERRFGLEQFGRACAWCVSIPASKWAIMAAANRVETSENDQEGIRSA